MNEHDPNKDLLSKRRNVTVLCDNCNGFSAQGTIILSDFELNCDVTLHSPIASEIQEHHLSTHDQRLGHGHEDYIVVFSYECFTATIFANSGGVIYQGSQR